MKTIKSLRYLVGLVITLLPLYLASAQAAATSTSIANKAAEDFGRLPLIKDLQISPDGKKVAYFQEYEGQYTLINKSLKAGSKAKVFTMERGELRSFFWASDDRLIVTVSIPYFSHGDDELFLLWRTLLFNVNNSQLIKVFKGEKYKYSVGSARFVSHLPNDPDNILMSHGSELYKVSLKDGSRDRVERVLKSTASWWPDAQGNPLLRSSYSNKYAESIWFHRANPTLEYQPLLVEKEGKEIPFDHYILGLSADGQSIYYKNTNKDKFEAIYRAKVVNNRVLKPKELPGFKGLDVNSVIKDYHNDTVTATYYPDHYAKTDYFTLPLAQVQADLGYTFANARIEITSYNKARTRFVAEVSGAEYGVEYYLYDTTAGSITLLANAYPNYDKKAAGKVTHFDYEANDGIKLTSYLTTPASVKDKPPLIVLPHGGPASRDSMAFDWMRQFYAAEGFVVFQPNFRGSEGFGQVFEEAGHKQWGKKMQTDIDDGVAQLIKKGLVNKDKICIVGASYGGYAAMMGATTQPQTYKCAVSFAGVSLLEDMFYFAKEQWSFGSFSYWKKSIGDRFDDAQMDKYSPLMQVSEKTSPILLIHGEKDTVVPSRQSRRMYKKLKEFKELKGNQFIELDNGDHWFTYGESRKVFLEKSNAFIRQHLQL